MQSKSSLHAKPTAVKTASLTRNVDIFVESEISVDDFKQVVGQLLIIIYE